MKSQIYLNWAEELGFLHLFHFFRKNWNALVSFGSPVRIISILVNTASGGGGGLTGVESVAVGKDWCRLVLKRGFQQREKDGQKQPGGARQTGDESTLDIKDERLKCTHMRDCYYFPQFIPMLSPPHL